MSAPNAMDGITSHTAGCPQVVGEHLAQHSLPQGQEVSCMVAPQLLEPALYRWGKAHTLVNLDSLQLWLAD